MSSARKAGQQIRGPISVNSAGMTTVRTAKVSSRIPRPTMMPCWVSVISGSTPSTQNTAASAIPALVMTAPVAEREEDGVVDTKRHQEQEREQRGGVIQRGEAE